MFSVFIEHYKNNEKLRLFTKIIVVWLLSRLVMCAMVPVMNLVADTPHNLLYYMNPWDAEWYKELAEEGYKLPRSSGMANWAFFPLYPMVCALIRIITGGYINTYAIGMLVSNICIIIAVYYAVRFAWLELDTDKYDRVDIENIIIFLMFAGPCAVYYGSMYTESLFTMCVVLCFYNTKKKNYMMAGVSAAFASATRIVGCTLIVVLLTDMYVSMYKQHRDEERRIVAAIKAFIKDVISDAGKLLALAICPLGIFVYMTFLRGFCGDAWAFYHVQKAWRTQKLFPVIIRPTAVRSTIKPLLILLIRIISLRINVFSILYRFFMGIFRRKSSLMTRMIPPAAPILLLMILRRMILQRILRKMLMRILKILPKRMNLLMEMFPVPPQKTLQKLPMKKRLSNRNKYDTVVIQHS